MQLNGCDLLISKYGQDKVLERLEKYINTHKWFLNEKIPYEVSYTSAVFSWYENVYRPLMYEIEKFPTYSAFKGWDLIDVFSGVSDKHYFLSEDGKYHSYAEALRDFVIENSNSFWVRVLTKLYY